MSNDDNIDREVRAALEERAEWINQVTALNWQAVQRAVNESTTSTCAR